MKKILMLVSLILALGVQANALAVGSGGGKKSVSRMLDASGNPVLFDGDKPWKVFEASATATPQQLVDEGGTAPKQGLVRRICVESSVAAVSTADTVIVWDTAVAANITAAAMGHRILPPFQRTSGAMACQEINAEFTSGIGVMNTLGTGTAYIYWRELGGYK